MFQKFQWIEAHISVYYLKNLKQTKRKQHICQSTHLLVNTFASQYICQSTHLLVNTFASQHTCQSTHLLVNTFASQHTCQSTHLLVNTFASQHICQLIVASSILFCLKVIVKNAQSLMSIFFLSQNAFCCEFTYMKFSLSIIIIKQLLFRFTV